jgi:NADH-quinone oxidoreductase subunit H
MTAADVIATIVRALLAAGIVLSLVPLTVWLERKGAAYIQDRPGPNRAAAFGIFRLGGVTHVVADAIKLIAKEDVMPAHVDPFYWKLAPMLVGMIPLMTFAIIPMADDFRVGSFVTPLSLLVLDGGLLWFFAITSLAVYGVVFAGWSSGNKYALLGGVRSTAQLLSYEIPMAISALGVILTFGTVQPNELVRLQGELLFGFIPQWGVVLQPLGAILFLTCAFAEINRVPFDLAEGEAELVAGYHTEYTGMRFGTFFLAEYMALIVSGALSVTLFFGGWQVPFFPTERLVGGAGTLLPAFLGLGAVVCGILGWAGYRHYQTYTKGRWNDRRDYEPLILGSILFALAMVQLVLAGAAWGARDGLAAWIPPLFATVVQLSAFGAKLCLFCWVFVWVRWSLPRFRYDQLLNLGWKALLPISLLNLLLTGVFLSLTSLPSATTTWVVLGVGILAGSLVVWTFRRQEA